MDSAFFRNAQILSSPSKTHPLHLLLEASQRTIDPAKQLTGREVQAAKAITAIQRTRVDASFGAFAIAMVHAEAHEDALLDRPFGSGRETPPGLDALMQVVRNPDAHLHMTKYCLRSKVKDAPASVATPATLVESPVRAVKRQLTVNATPNSKAKQARRCGPASTKKVVKRPTKKAAKSPAKKAAKRSDN